jgi:hypothetical protein
MVDAQNLSIVFAGVSIGVAAIYYALTLRNTQRNQELALETRQAQMFMNFYENYRSQEFRKNYYHYLFVQEWTTRDELLEQYGPDKNMEVYSGNGSIYGFFEGVGFLLKNGFIDIRHVNELLGASFVLFWRKAETYVIESRTVLGLKVYPNAEYLSEELEKYYEKYPELNPFIKEE